jgi:hypothetical protein
MVLSITRYTSSFVAMAAIQDSYMKSVTAKIKSKQIMTTRYCVSDNIFHSDFKFDIFDFRFSFRFSIFSFRFSSYFAGVFSMCGVYVLHWYTIFVHLCQIVCFFCFEHTCWKNRNVENRLCYRKINQQSKQIF